MPKSGHSSNRRFLRGERLAWQTVGEETVVIDLGRNLAFSLNQRASVLWARLENASTVEDLVSLLDDVDVDRGSIEQDVESFVDELQDAGLVVITEGASRGELPRPESPPLQGDAPRILWSEELQACVMQGSCGFGPGTACETIPPGPFGP